MYCSSFGSCVFCSTLLNPASQVYKAPPTDTSIFDIASFLSNDHTTTLGSQTAGVFFSQAHPPTYLLSSVSSIQTLTSRLKCMFQCHSQILPKRGLSVSTFRNWCSVLKDQLGASFLVHSRSKKCGVKPVLLWTADLNAIMKPESFSFQCF